MERKEVTKFDAARLHCIKVAVEQDFDVEGDPQSSPWLVKGVRKARQGEEITVEDIRNFDNPSSAI